MRQRRAPCDQRAVVRGLKFMRSMLVQRQHNGIVQQHHGLGVHEREVRADDQRAARNGPQRHQRDLLVIAQARRTRLAPAGMRTQLADGQHVGVRPGAWFGVALPRRQPRKLAQHALRKVRAGLPLVPLVVRDAPHVGQRCGLIAVLQRHGARREAQHHGPASAVDRLADHLDLVGLVRVVADAVDLEQVHAPGRILREQGVVPGLPGGVVLYAPVGRVPGAGVRGIGGVPGMVVAARDGQVALHAGARYPAHNVDAEQQSLRVHPVAQRHKAGVLNGGGEPGIGRNRHDDLSAIAGGGKARRHGHVTPIRIDGVVQLVRRVAVLRVLKEPALVDDRIAPARAGEPVLQHAHVGAELRLGDGEPVAVPTVPAHGRRVGDARHLRGSVRHSCRSHDREGESMKIVHGGQNTIRRCNLGVRRGIL